MVRTTREGLPAIKVLNKGEVALIDYMGSDQAAIDAARISYSSNKNKESSVDKDKDLLRYLMRNNHHTPFEMSSVKLYVKAPIFVFRQWHRHRTFCLSGDTLLSFDLPGGIKRKGWQSYKLQLKDVYRKFLPTKGKRADKQGNPYYKKHQIQKMMLRCVNTDTNTVTHTNIIDVWESGIKKTYKVTLKNGLSVKMSADHLCYTNKGFLKLREIVKLPTDETPYELIDNDIRLATIVRKSIKSTAKIIDHDYTHEVWKPIPEWEGYYEVSDKGRVKSLRSGIIKKNTKLPSNYYVISLNKPGKQITRLLHSLVADSFIPKPSNYIQDKLEICHNDGNGLNNEVSNLRYGTSKDNSDDLILHGTVAKLNCVFHEIEEVAYAGEENTYDVSVKGPYHNFNANGIVVHNSINEVSGRYSQLTDDCYIPDNEHVTFQNLDNKQGGTNETLPPFDAQSSWADDFRNEQIDVKFNYEYRLNKGMRKELARINLPLAQYSEMYVTANLRNWFHFLELRLDLHAQYEIRVYAEAVIKILRELFPLSVEAFADYILQSARLSKIDQIVLQHAIAEFVTRTDEISNGYHEAILEGLIIKHAGNFIANGREHRECIEKLKKVLNLQN